MFRHLLPLLLNKKNAVILKKKKKEKQTNQNQIASCICKSSAIFPMQKPLELLKEFPMYFEKYGYKKKKKKRESKNQHLSQLPWTMETWQRSQKECNIKIKIHQLRSVQGFVVCFSLGAYFDKDLCRHFVLMQNKLWTNVIMIVILSAF